MARKTQREYNQEQTLTQYGAEQRNRNTLGLVDQLAANAQIADQKAKKLKTGKYAKYNPYQVSAEEVAKYLPASGLNLPGFTQYQATPITITDKKILKSRRLRDAEMMRQIQLQVAQAARAENQARLQAAYADINQQISGNQGYGAFQQAQLDRQRLQNISSQNANFRRRGLQNTTINTDRGINADYSLANMALQGQLQDRQNQLLQNRANFLGGVSNPIPSYNELAYGAQQPGAVSAALASERAQADAARDARQNQWIETGTKLFGAGLSLATGNPLPMMATYGMQQQPSFLPQNPGYGQSR